ncbi:MAG TPA: DUF309 domain-containing protein [Gemmataceae bacterium]|nr:DUF309 domain-containing protein [Gemmataceae bacterium]
MSERKDSAPRLIPDEPFPAYAFIPGRNPHPTSDPAGHSYRIEPAVPDQVHPEKWRECRPYLFGIDLFNAGYFWESHAAWESVWIACGRRGIVADFLKGLIKLAAAGVKASEGKAAGVVSHSGRAVELFSHVGQATNHLMGFTIVDLIALAEDIRKNGWPVDIALRVSNDQQ